MIILLTRALSPRVSWTLWSMVRISGTMSVTKEINSSINPYWATTLCSIVFQIAAATKRTGGTRSRRTEMGRPVSVEKQKWVISCNKSLCQPCNVQPKYQHRTKMILTHSSNGLRVFGLDRRILYQQLDSFSDVNLC